MRRSAQDAYTFAAAQALQDDGRSSPATSRITARTAKTGTKREPVRAISAITPFNHPLNMVSHKIAPSIATNNCMVCKPMESTPLTAITLADILMESRIAAWKCSRW
ncbi:MAG: aldehyde dehydrogenase family protein [Paracoccaceae bacterium]